MAWPSSDHGWPAFPRAPSPRGGAGWGWIRLRPFFAIAAAGGRTFIFHHMDSAPRTDWDVIVMGGALAGSATACLLRRKNPQLRVLILERSERLKRRVGESTVEISAYFLGRVLGLTDHLLEKHIPKQGMRFWFANDRTRALDQCSETGPRYNVRLPGYQVDR